MYVHMGALKCKPSAGDMIIKKRENPVHGMSIAQQLRSNETRVD